ncbi:hypothetical protein B0T21DRAFT_440852 [Apiosordaria backusii]|uniref:Uncharacterized protein n=1 Tax=Apiosordaria backusii TaxID=314023 RepID=A0AA40BLJ6_9PEZI|nr:hypothetical protein B0T21DRAFT_440852 [Apiosordaria backusii]
MPGGISDDRESLEKIIALCGSFLTLRDQTVYFVYQSAQDFLFGKASDKASKKASRVAFGWVFPSGIERFPIDSIRVPDPDLLATVRYLCVYWIDHLRHSVSCLYNNKAKVLFSFNKKLNYYFINLNIFKNKVINNISRLYYTNNN